MKLQILGAAILVFGNVAPSLAAEEGTPNKTEPSNASYVRPIDLAALAARARDLPPRSQAILQLYLEGARRYVLTPQDGAFPDPGGSDHFRSLAERAHGAAVLAEFADQWPDELRARCRRDSAAFVREFVAEFEKDRVEFERAPFPAKKRGPLDYGWQSSWWTAELAAAAWFLWDRLDPSLQQGVADMVVYHADHIAALKPGARVNLDTEAETVAWNTTILTWAANLFARHPHNAKWQEAARQYAYTVFATPKDLLDATPGDDGRPIKDWVVGANIHDDFTLENHNRFHIDYEYTCYRFLIFGAAMYRLGGNPVPDALTHHVSDVYEKVLLACTNAGKFAVFVSDNDWRRYHLWTESSAVHGFLALMERSPLASALEEQSLKQSVSYWREFPERFSYANPYVCGRAWTPRIADIVLLHLLMPPPPAPLSPAEAEARLQGAHERPNVHLLTEYSREGSFRSFYCGPGPTVRHIEARDNAWMLLPLTIDYGLAINGKPGPDAGAKVHSGKGADWFWALRHDARGVDDAFISLPDEIVVLMTAASAPVVKNARRVDSVVSIEKPHKSLDVYYQGGSATFRYGQRAWERSDKVAGRDFRSDWVNLADSIGYVVVDLSHDASCMVLPKPGVRDSLSLRHVEKPGHDQAYITVVFPNQDHHQTEAMRARISGNYSGGVMTCLAPPYFVAANFTDHSANIELPQDIGPAGPATIPPNSVGIWDTRHQAETKRRVSSVVSPNCRIRWSSGFSRQIPPKGGTPARNINTYLCETRH